MASGSGSFSLKELIREDYKFFIIFIMLGAVMYWTAIVVGPTLDIAEQNKDILNATIAQNDLMLVQNDEIIDNQNRNANVSVAVFNQTGAIRSEAIVQFNEVLNRIDAEIDGQTVLLVDLIEAHANVSREQSLALYAVINNTYAEVIPAINQSMMEHREKTETETETENGNIGNYIVLVTDTDSNSAVGNITAGQEALDKMLSNQSQQQVNKLLNDLAESQLQAGTIAGAEDFGGPQVLNMTNQTNSSR